MSEKPLGEGATPGPRDGIGGVRWVALGALLLAGCAATPPAPGPRIAVPVTPPPAAVAPPAATATSEIDADPLFRLLVAEFAGQRGHLDVAVQQYLELARTHDDAELAQRATRIAVFAHDTAAALEAAQLWIKAAPADPDARQIAAAMYVRQGNAAAALQHLEVLLHQNPQNFGAQMRMIANLLGREDDQRTALAVMEKLVAGRSDDPDAMFAYALLAIRAEQLDKARTIIERIIAKPEVDASVAMAYVTVLQKQGKTSEAIDWLGKQLTADKSEFGLRLIYARLLADANRYEESRLQFVILAQETPDNPDVLYALGLLNLQAGRIDEAENNFAALLKLGERRDDAYYYLGQIAESRQQADQALVHYRAMENGPNYFQGQIRIALLLSTRKEIDLARQHLRSIRPENQEQASQLVRVEGEILTEHERYADAMGLYDKALSTDSNDTDLLYTRAMLAEKMGQLDVVERDLRAIIAHEPDNAQALNALGYTLANRTQRYQEAHDLIARALAISPDDFYILDSMGWVLYRLGRLQDSLPYLERARGIRNDPEVAAHLGEVLWVLGDRQGARNVWDSALQGRPNDRILLDVIERLAP